MEEAAESRFLTNLPSCFGSEDDANMTFNILQLWATYDRKENGISKNCITRLSSVVVKYTYWNEWISQLYQQECIKQGTLWKYNGLLRLHKRWICQTIQFRMTLRRKFEGVNNFLRTDSFRWEWNVLVREWSTLAWEWNAEWFGRK